MNKMKCEWGCGEDTFIIDLMEEKIYSYEVSYKVLHQKFGGGLYYISRSGLNGAGWIESRPELLKVGSYRPDTGLLPIRGGDYNVLPIYIPLNLHSGIWWERENVELTFPIVIEKGCKFFFIYNLQSLFRYLKGEEIETRNKKIEFRFFDRNLNWQAVQVSILTEALFRHKKGVDIRRFINWETAIEEASRLKETSEMMAYLPFSRGRAVWKAVWKKENSYFIGNQFGFIDWFSTHNPFTDLPRSEKIVDGWFSSGGENFLYRRIGDVITCIYCIPTVELKQGKYLGDHKSPYVVLNKDVSLIEFFSQDMKYWGKQLQGECAAPLESRYSRRVAAEQRREKTLSLLQEHKEETLTVEDAIKARAGCLDGIKDWVEKYGFGEKEVKVFNILEHKDIKEIVSNSHFQKVVMWKWESSEKSRCS